MNIHVVKVPDIGEGIAEVELVLWHVEAGDTVVADQTLVDVMTDKATVEVPSPVAGRVLALSGNAGDKLAVGSELIRIAVDEAAIAVPGQRRCGRARVDGGTVRRGGARRVGDRGQAAGVAVGAPSGARALGGPGAGAGKRARRACPARGRRPLCHAARRETAGSATPASAQRHGERNGEQQVPVIGLRRQIALRMQDALRIPHFTYVEEIDVTELEALRARLNAERGRARGHLTVLPFLMRAIVLAVRSFPQLNARYDDAQGIVTRFAAVHIGIATQTDGGLLVPVVRHAEALDLWASAAEVARLADAARGGKARREELSGSTITITSLGPRGGIVTTPIINPPEVAIVGVNRIVERPVIRAGAVVPRLLMNLSSSFDHRVVDGQHAADFVQALRGCLECPALLFVDP